MASHRSKTPASAATRNRPKKRPSLGPSTIRREGAANRRLGPFMRNRRLRVKCRQYDRRLRRSRQGDLEARRPTTACPRLLKETSDAEVPQSSEDGSNVLGKRLEGSPVATVRYGKTAGIPTPHRGQRLHDDGAFRVESGPASAARPSSAYGAWSVARPVARRDCAPASCRPGWDTLRSVTSGGVEPWRTSRIDRRCPRLRGLNPSSVASSRQGRSIRRAGLQLREP